jgi:TetR/AcrR family tetracycline transcriptional repressor
MAIQPKQGKNRGWLSRERIVDAALRVMDEEGLEGVSMRRVAREVGVEAMSLYHHVRDKDDLLQGICGRVMSSYEFPDEKGSWVERAKAGARAWRRLLQQHPDVMRLFAVTHGPSPMSAESLHPTEFALRLLKESGLSDRDSVQAFHMFGGYIQGFVMMEGGSIKPDRAVADVAEIDADSFPTIAAVSTHWGDCDPDQQFEFGLDVLIRGLQAKVEADSASEEPQLLP